MTGSDLVIRPAWAPGGAAFTPPSTAPSRPFPTELRPTESPRETKKDAQQKSGRLGTVLLSMTVIVLVVAASLMIWSAFVPESVAAPLPASEFETPVDAPVVGPTGTDPVDVGGVEMTAASMGPNTLFIPALGVYMPIEADSKFVKSKYAGFDTLRIPKNPKHGVWFKGGAPLYGGASGVTMIASHVSNSTGWGALRYLYKLTGGEMIYTKDGDGQLQSWQMTEMRVEKHTDFPQEYWSPEGERMLVITTCGGTLTRNGNFRQNIFVVAVPVDPKPKSAEQLHAESVIAAVEVLAVQRSTEALAGLAPGADDAAR